MISSKDIEDYSYLVSDRFEAINTHYLKLIAKQINDIGRLGPANLHRLQQMAKFNQNIEEINKLLAQETNRTLKELYQVYDMSGFSLYNDYAKLFKANGRTQIPFNDNVVIQGYLNSVKSLTQGTFMNMSNTTAISHSNYQKLVDTAIDAIATGQTDYNSMIRNQLLTIADEGLTITYASGYKRRLDSAVRMNVLEGVRKVNEGVRQVSGEQFGADGYEVSVHALCASDHIDIQGKQYAIGDVEKTVAGKTYESFNMVNGALKRHLGTCNCKHTIFPIILGISEPTYTDSELKQYRDNSQKQVTLTMGYNADGTPKTKTMTKYEATQVQRNLETEIRRAKDRHIIFENTGDDIGTKQAKDKILALRKTYSFISQEAGLTPKWDRTFVAGYTGKQSTPKPITLSYKSNNVDIKLIGSGRDTEIFSDLEDMYVPQSIRDKFDDIRKMKTYEQFEEYLKGKGISLDTGLDKLKNEKRNVEIPAVYTQTQKIRAAIETYEELFGKDALKSLNKVILYDDDLESVAAYTFNRIGEKDPLAGSISFSDWNASNREIFHELAHAFQDSHKLSREDAITASNRISELAKLNKNVKVHAIWNDETEFAEKMADTMAYAFAHGNKEGIEFLKRLITVLK